VRKRKQDGSYSGYSYIFPEITVSHQLGITMIPSELEPQPGITMSHFEPPTTPPTRDHGDLSEPEVNLNLKASEVTDVTSAANRDPWESPEVQTLVKEFVDMAREQNTEPPKRVIGQVASELKKLSAEASEPELRAALKRLLERGLHPSSLPSALFDVRQRGSTNGHDPLGELLAAHAGKWPTGTRLVRGSNGAAYVQDPLGYDTPNHAVRWVRPTRPEILSALRKDSG
jgi:hypothetical protein